MKNLKWILIGSALLIAGVAGFFIIRKVRKNKIEDLYGSGNTGNKSGLSEDQAQMIADNIQGALSGWTSAQDQEDIFTWLAECKSKADLELVIARFNATYPDKLVQWLKSDVDADRMKSLFNRFGVSF